ncbi:MAG: nuclear transport factor 2 family protein [Gammaproteobacteria bacterium]|jgi:limonene-1,2-epoxide hydrolase
MTDTVEHFKHVFTNLERSNIGLVDTLYDDNVTFIDPFHKIHGREKLRDYFNEMYQNVVSCDFQFRDTYINDGSAMITWNMLLNHKTLARNEPIKIAGSSLIRFNDNKVYFHRDYFDAGQLVYERLPLLGPIIKFIKQRV